MLYIVAFVTFFDNYAFDDSYVGYTIARSVLQGHGFTFNESTRMLSTSAPLAVPLYAAFAWLFHTTVVHAAQWLSALALATIVFGAYALARRAFAPFGAFTGAAILASSPFIVLLWSHETLLYLATIVAGTLLYVRERRLAAALVLGAASLLRGEALLLLPFFWFAEYRRSDARNALLFVAASLIPYVSWALWATATFGTFLSATIASKHAQGLYEGIPSYLAGLAWFVGALYARTPSFAWGAAVTIALCACVAIAAAYRLLPRYGWALALWVLLTTALYLVLRLPFYFWFASQFGIAMALFCASMWPRDAASGSTLLPLGRICALAVLALNVAFLATSAVTHAFPAHGAVAGVAADLHHNPYKMLGLYLSEHARKDETISFVEFGQLRYYADRDVVDYLGLATPGAAQQLANGNAIWTFKTYHPSWVIDSPPWQLFVSPTEYDWFREAYERKATLLFAGDPIRNRFTLYHLRSRQTIPTSDEPDPSVHVGDASASPNALEIPFTTTQPGAIELEARIDAPPSCARVTIALVDTSGTVATTARTLDRLHNPSRVTLTFPALASGAYRVRISGCGVRLARTPQPEHSFTLYRAN